MRRTSLALIAMMVILALALLVVPGSAAELHVGAVQPYTTIQAAINAADTVNNTIIVHNGTYKENLAVNKSNIVIRSDNGSSVTIISSNNTNKHVVNISDQTNVTLKGFEIRDADGTTQDVAGIWMYNATGCTISNITVTNVSGSSSSYAYGIYLSSSSNNRFNSSTSVSTISATNMQAYGIYLSQSSNNTFNSSTSVSNITGGIAYGIYLSSSSNNTFSSSTYVSTITSTGEDEGEAYGILLWDSSNNTFSSSTYVSTITSIYANGYAYGIFLWDSSNNNTFSTNTSISTISANRTAYGIYLSSSSNNRFNSSTSVSSISATNMQAYGIYLSQSSNNTFNSSTSVSNITSEKSSAYGIYLYRSSSNTFNSSTSVSDITGSMAAAGIYLFQSSNHNTFNSSTSVSNITGGIAYGFYLDYSNNNTFNSSTSVSTITSTGEDEGEAYGISLEYSNNNTFNSSTSVSTITSPYTNGYAYGIFLLDSRNSTFNSNISVSTISATRTAYGIHLYSNSHDNRFSSNISVSTISATDNFACGIYLSASRNNRFNSSTTVSRVNSSHQAYGIRLTSAFNNLFSTSTSVSNVTGVNQTYGIYLSSSSDNTFNSSSSVIATVTSVNDTAYGIYLAGADRNNFTGVTIHPPLTGSESYEFYSEADCDDNVVTDMTIGNSPTTISFTYGNGVWLKRVNGSERPGDPNYRNISKYINASNLTANSWLFVNFSYSQNDLIDAGISDEDTLKVWKYNGTWNEEGWNESRVLDTVNNVVGVNITRFCIFAPLVYIPTSVAIPTATGTGNTTITASSGYFCNYSALDKTYFPFLPESSATFHHGFFNLSICGLNTTNPENVTINFTFPSAIPTDAEFWKYNSSNGTWYPFPFEDNDGDNIITITITDNGPGDHNPANGTITDPNGIGWSPTAAVPTLTPLGLIALLGLLSAVVALTIRKRQ